MILLFTDILQSRYRRPSMYFRPVYDFADSRSMR